MNRNRHQTQRVPNTTLVELQRCSSCVTHDIDWQPGPNEDLGSISGSSVQALTFNFSYIDFLNQRELSERQKIAK